MRIANTSRLECGLHGFGWPHLVLFLSLSQLGCRCSMIDGRNQMVAPPRLPEASRRRRRHLAIIVVFFHQNAVFLNFQRSKSDQSDRIGSRSRLCRGRLRISCTLTGQSDACPNAAHARGLSSNVGAPHPTGWGALLLAGLASARVRSMRSPSDQSRQFVCNTLVLRQARGAQKDERARERKKEMEGAREWASKQTCTGASLCPIQMSCLID